MGQSQHENSDVNSNGSRDSTSSDGSVDISQSLLGREGQNNDNNSSFESLVAPLPNIPGTGGVNSRSGSNFNFSAGTPAIWQGRGHPFARNRSRRRANSLDEVMPVPRIQLRPRFTRHVNLNATRAAGNDAGGGADSVSGSGSGSGGTINMNNSPTHLMFRQQQHDPSDPSCSCLECLLRAMPSRSNSRSSGNTPPTSNQDEDHQNRNRRSGRNRPTHFRSHTYNGSDSTSNTDIFAMALQTEQFSETSAPTVPVIHGSPAFPFELSSLQQNLPPAAQAFFAPAPRDGNFSHSNSLSAAGSNSGSVSGSGSVRELNSNRDKKVGSYENPSRPIPRHHPNRKLPGHGNSHGHVRHASGGTTTGTGTVVTGIHHSPFRTSPSMGTATCTLSLSSVSAFDQTTSPHWQQHSMSLSSQAQSPPDHFFDQDQAVMSSPPWQHQLSLSSQSPGHSHNSIVFEKLETQEHEETATSRTRSSIHARAHTDQGHEQGQGQHQNQKEGIARSHSRTASSSDFNDNIEGRNRLLTKEARSTCSSNSNSRSLPFDEVHLLIDHEQQHDERKPKPNPDGSTSSSSAQAQAQAQTPIKTTSKTKEPES
eukprot:CAMPEP_0194098348 /NCGR_PEP_ID=MMETSP0149-20130528/58332_1 /TAXON_ID=122233 /ORGANISM="Chaetoceros debilis, Strain MM31A-1" /LENGTH=593 /DNA_ID=CAMNT_0038784393 /DNA_START=84 /DNA_END=1865 /DNA_ORIENTATION=-